MRGAAVTESLRQEQRDRCQRFDGQRARHALIEVERVFHEHSSNSRREQQADGHKRSSTVERQDHTSRPYPFHDIGELLEGAEPSARHCATLRDHASNHAGDDVPRFVSSLNFFDQGGRGATCSNDHDTVGEQPCATDLSRGGSNEQHERDDADDDGACVYFSRWKCEHGAQPQYRSEGGDICAHTDGIEGDGEGFGESSVML